MHQCCPQHLCMGRVIIKEDKETKEAGKQGSDNCEEIMRARNTAFTHAYLIALVYQGSLLPKTIDKLRTHILINNKLKCLDGAWYTSTWSPKK